MNLNPTIHELIFINRDDINRPLANIEIFFDDNVRCYFIDVHVDENTHTMMGQIDPDLLDEYMMALDARITGYDYICDDVNGMIWENMVDGLITADGARLWAYHALIHVLKAHRIEILDVDESNRYITVGAMYGKRFGDDA